MIDIAGGQYVENVQLDNAADANLTLDGSGDNSVASGGTEISAPTASNTCDCAVKMGSASVGGITLNDLGVAVQASAGDKQALYILGADGTATRVTASQSGASQNAILIEGDSALLQGVVATSLGAGAGVLSFRSAEIVASTVGTSGGSGAGALIVVGGTAQAPSVEMTVTRSLIHNAGDGDAVQASAQTATATASLTLDSSRATGGERAAMALAAAGGDASVAIVNSTLDAGSAGGSDDSAAYAQTDTGSTSTMTLDSSIALGGLVRTGDGTESIDCTFTDVSSGQTDCPPGSNGNTSSDPATLFVNPVANDYHLLPGSSAADSGNPAKFFAAQSDADIEGRTRVADANGDCNFRRDKGAYELPTQAANCSSTSTGGATQLGGGAPATLPGASGSPARPISSLFSFGRFTLARDGSGRLVLVLPGAGGVAVQDGAVATGTRLAARKRKRKALIKRVALSATRAGPVTIAIRPSKAGRKVLRRKRRLRVKLRVTYTPRGGRPATQTKTVTLKLKR